MGGPNYKGIKRKDAKGLYAGKIDLERANKRVLTVLDREIAYLMMESHVAPLAEERSKALIAYCKLIRDLREQKTEVNSAIPEEKLTKLASSDFTQK